MGVIPKWESCGLTQVQFFKEHKLPKRTFGYWLKKYLKEQIKSDNTKGFIPFQASSSEDEIVAST